MNQPELKNTSTPEHELGHYIHFMKWSLSCTCAELKELDRYIQEKIVDLVKKFQLIAQNAAAHMKQTTELSREDKTIQLGDKNYSYSEATKELHRLTDALLSETKLTSDLVATRKKVDKLALAIFNFTKDNEGIEGGPSDNIKIITANIKEIIVAFQFQDFVKQRLTHIEIILQTMEEETGKAIANIDDKNGVPTHMAQALLDKFFLSNVKETFIAGLDPEQAKSLNVTIESEEDDVELF